MIEKAIQLIKKHEGLRLNPYHCTAGKLTMGYGRNLDDNGISKEEAEILLKHDVERVQQEANTLPFFSALNVTRQAVIIDMIFNLGFSRFRQFKKMCAALACNDYQSASLEMLDSQWARQVQTRAQELSRLMREGK